MALIKIRPGAGIGGIGEAVRYRVKETVTGSRWVQDSATEIPTPRGPFFQAQI